MDENKKKLDFLKKEMSKGKQKDLDVDLDAVQNIVTKMKNKDKKSRSQGQVSESHLKEIRDIIEEGKLSKLNIDTETKLVGSSDSKLDKQIVKFYNPFQKIINKIVEVVIRNDIGKKIAFNLYSANIKRSLVQHLVISIIFAILISAFVTFMVAIIFIFLSPIALVVIPFLFLFLFIIFFIAIGYIMPAQKANLRGVMIDTELPFALRHLATELQAGIGLYKTIYSIAKNDYGVLSDELSRTIIEIENGTDTKTALRHTALRSKSKNFNISLFHIVRTLNTGGNLAESVNGVADTVSFDLMESSKAFGEKMNFFGVIFIFVAIVLPVFVAILGAIANAPIGQDGAAFLPGVMTPNLLVIIYLVIMPIIFIGIMYYIKMIEPKT
jgi:archaeal flagellar protein FlaJ